jgi:ribosome-binding factor A
MSSLCEPQRDEDPDPFSDNKRRRCADHKTLRLCRQVLEALQISVAGECGDEVLQQLFIAAVTPAADPSKLEVTVELPRDVSPADALAHLEKARGLLRTLVAQAICRKKVPDLVFRVTGPEEGGR